jgi:hypothetical protein
MQLRVPSWVSDEVPTKPKRRAKPTQKRRSPNDEKPRNGGPKPVPTAEPRSTPAASPKNDDAAFSALRLLRANKATLQLCDHRATRSGQKPPSRIHFHVVVDSQGQAKVEVNAETPISAAIARCYQNLAGSWRYPATGETYILHLSRVAPDRR